MEDLALTLGTLALAAGVLSFAWNRAAGPARSRVRRAARVSVALALASVAAGAATYSLTKSRTFQLAGDLVPRVETAERVVALTFDDGPTAAHTGEVLRMLEDGGVKATFYLTGRESEENPDQLRAIVEAGHELGNHTYSHRRMYFLSRTAAAREIERTDAAFRSAGYEAVTTFRPPGCKRLLTAPLYMGSRGRTTVTWDLEPDSLPGVAQDATAIVDHVMENVRPGSIVLLHVMYDSREPTRMALPALIDALAEDGYRFVTISQLLAER